MAKRYSNTNVAKEKLALIGFRLDPDSERPEFYTVLIHGGEKDRPLQINERIVFFNDYQSFTKVQTFRDSNVPTHLRKNKYSPQRADLVCDIAEVLYLIESEDEDKSAMIINCINTLSDLLPAAGLKLPAGYKTILTTFADHLTFHREYGKFLRRKNLSRSAIRDAILWCLGCIAARAKFLIASAGQKKQRGLGTK
jgi:hypothetical protein